MLIERGVSVLNAGIRSSVRLTGRALFETSYMAASGVFEPPTLFWELQQGHPFKRKLWATAPFIALTIPAFGVESLCGTGFPKAYIIACYGLGMGMSAVKRFYCPSDTSLIETDKAA